MIAVGDETGDLDDLMQEVAELYEREVDYEVKTLAAQIEPILIVFLGVMVLILALAVFLPMWDLAQVAAQTLMRNRGFTLIELLIVISIVAILFGVGLERLLRYQEMGERAAVEQNVGAINTALNYEIRLVRRAWSASRDRKRSRQKSDRPAGPARRKTTWASSIRRI